MTFNQFKGIIQNIEQDLDMKDGYHITAMICVNGVFNQYTGGWCFVETSRDPMNIRSIIRITTTSTMTTEEHVFIRIEDIFSIICSV